MRVYLDGSEAGLLQRPGQLRAGGPAAGCIGSSDGGENYQGMIDDLRIYAAALTPQEIAALYSHGVDVLTKQDAQLTAQLAAFYIEKQSLAETLAVCRRQLLERNVAPHTRLASIVAARLKAAHPDEYQQFVQWTGASPAEYLFAADNQFNVRTAGRLIELLLEYQPLTPEQWQRQTPEQRAAWEELDTFRQRFKQLEGLGEAGSARPSGCG